MRRGQSSKKRKVGQGTSREGVWELSDAAKQWQDKFLKNRQCIPERGIELDRDEFPHIWDNIDERHWVNFVKHPKGFDHTLVQDFYAALEDFNQDEKYVLFRGMPVHLGKKVINAYYGITRIPRHRDNYESGCTHELDETELRYLARPGFQLAHGNPNIRKAWLQLDTRIWVHFVQYCLMPSTSFKDLKKERARLIYAIKARKHIDVGKVIMEQILTIRRETQQGLPFPCLITGLCQAAGVPNISDQYLTRTKRALNAQSYRLIKAGFDADTAALARPAAESKSAEELDEAATRAPARPAAESESAEELEEAALVAAIPPVENFDWSAIQTLMEQHHQQQQHWHDQHSQWHSQQQEWHQEVITRLDRVNQRLDNIDNWLARKECCRHHFGPSSSE